MKRQDKKYYLKIYNKLYKNLVLEYYSDNEDYLIRKYKDFFLTNRCFNMNYYNYYYEINFYNSYFDYK